MKSYNSKDGIIGKGYLGKFLKKKLKLKIFIIPKIFVMLKIRYLIICLLQLVQKNFLQTKMG